MPRYSWRLVRERCPPACVGLPPSSCGHGRRLDDDASWDAHEKLPPHHRPPIVAEAWDARRRRNRMSRPRLRYRNANGRTGVARRNRISDNNVLLGHTMTGNAARSAPPRMRATVTFSLSVQCKAALLSLVALKDFNSVSKFPLSPNVIHKYVNQSIEQRNVFKLHCNLSLLSAESINKVCKYKS